MERAVVLGGTHLPRDGWYVYYYRGFHGHHLYQVKAEEAEALFPQVVQRLRNAPPGALHADTERGFRAWLQTRPAEDDAAGFLATLWEERLDRWRQEAPELFEVLRQSEDQFGERYERIQRYSWNVAGEFVFLTGLIVFAAWPWLQGGGPLRWAIHLGLLPLLFCIPVWLGYAALSFTSAGASGGVLYAELLTWLPRDLPWTSFDTWMIQNLPPLLEPYSQTTGPMLSLSGGPGMGLVAAVNIGLTIALIPLGIWALFLRRRHWAVCSKRTGSGKAF